MAAGRTDLLAAIQRYGGLKHIANLLNLPLSTNCRPSGYWNDFGNVAKELQMFIALHGQQGIMPQQDDLVRYGYSSLGEALLRHGGPSLGEALLRHGGHAGVAERLNLLMPNKSKPSGYWLNFENIERELKDFMSLYGSDGIMPTLKDFEEHNQLGLAGAINRMGGFTTIAKRLHLRNRRPTLPRRWKDFQTLKTELERFMREHNLKGIMPTAAQLMATKRCDLMYAIGCFGGYQAVADKLHLTYVKSSRYKSAKYCAGPHIISVTGAASELHETTMRLAGSSI